MSTMSLTERWRWLTGGDGYAAANAGLIVIWLVLSVVAVATIPRVSIWIVPSVFAMLWTALSFRRIAVTHLWLLHLAPYLSIAGYCDVFWGLIEAANNGPWVIGYRPNPAWWGWLQIMGFPALLAWPGATLTLIFFKYRQTGFVLERLP